MFVDLLVQPIISISPSMDGVSVAQQQGLHVSKGSTFTISCSIQPQYPGGSFHLTFNGSNTTDDIQPAVNHSHALNAHFLFPAADQAHQGNYSCVYHVFVFSRNFSSESLALSLTVSGNLKDKRCSQSTLSFQKDMGVNDRLNRLYFIPENWLSVGVVLSNINLFILSKNWTKQGC